MTRTIFIGLIAALLTITSVSAASAADAFVIRHKVADYAKWRPFFDADKTNQEAAGLTNPRVYHAPTDTNDITIVFDAADLSKAKAFAGQKRLKAVMTKAGVVGKPTFWYLESAS